MAQFVVEVVCAAILAFGLSITTGAKVSQYIGDNLLSNEIATASEETDTSQHGTVMMAGSVVLYKIKKKIQLIKLM